MMGNPRQLITSAITPYQTTTPPPPSHHSTQPPSHPYTSTHPPQKAHGHWLSVHLARHADKFYVQRQSDNPASPRHPILRHTRARPDGSAASLAQHRAKPADTSAPVCLPAENSFAGSPASSLAGPE